MKKNLYIAVLLGVAWGIFEATVGYLLHWSGLKIGSMIWFPIAYFFTHKAYRATGTFRAAILTACIASSIKLVNLFFPGRIDMVINPAVSIILEALAVVLVYKYVINEQTDRVTPLTIALTGFIWRGLYICYIFAMPRAYFDISSFTVADSILEYMFVKNGINIAFISAGFFFAKVLKKYLDAVSKWIGEAMNRRAVMNPAFAVGSMIFAIAVQAVIG